jgi:hypothetical protein
VLTPFPVVTTRWFLPVLGAAFPWLAAAQSDFQGATHMVPFEEDTISYNQTPSTGPITPPSTGPITRLQARINRGEVRLKFDPAAGGWRDSLLGALEISPKSQTLLFSKTSL